MSKNIYLVLTSIGLISPNFYSFDSCSLGKIADPQNFSSWSSKSSTFFCLKAHPISPSQSLHHSQVYYILRNRINKDKSQPLIMISLISKFHIHSQRRIKLPHKTTTLKLTFSWFPLYLCTYPCFLPIKGNSITLLLQALYFTVHLLII